MGIDISFVSEFDLVYTWVAVFVYGESKMTVFILAKTPEEAIQLSREYLEWDESSRGVPWIFESVWRYNAYHYKKGSLL